ncbi:hypothetical protein [Paraburkholderia antibiotica]|uniref:Uncharacterized protein n=1 Tax=Paraburkholderia antibiotica TaxID=2728839 RepID=A0A7X9X542_9BURK|nr:hypothetical protein [Paraburkholderia antibiotica]NML31590.1 hypothetical protein [Paraburkholderia antibiotica]
MENHYSDALSGGWGASSVEACIMTTGAAFRVNGGAVDTMAYTNITQYRAFLKTRRAPRTSQTACAHHFNYREMRKMTPTSK